jgi:hypothetical protein
LILLSGLFISLSPVVHAADSNPVDPDLLERAVADLRDIIGVDMDLYTIAKSSQREGSNILNVQHTDIDLYLTSGGATIRLLVQYSKGYLLQVYLCDFSVYNPLKMRFGNAPTGILLRYQNVTGDSDYDEVLNGTNVKRDVTSVSKNTVSYSWIYCKDGVQADRKNIYIELVGGYFHFFLNNWPIYTIGNSVNNYNEMQAQQIAIKFMEHYYYNYTLDNGTVEKVSNFSIVNSSYLGHTHLTFINSADAASARGGDQTVFYLAWVVPMGFDKWYPGGVSMIDVILWADTGKVCSPAFDYPDNDSSNTSNWIMPSICITALLCTFAAVASLIVYYRKRSAKDIKSNVLCCSTP